MDGISSLLLIWIRNRLKYDEKNVGGISDISIKMFKQKNAEMPSAITGCEADGKTYYVQNVTLENFKVTYRDTKENLSVKNQSVKNQCVIIRRLQGVSHSYFIDHKLQWILGFAVLRYVCAPRKEC